MLKRPLDDKFPTNRKSEEEGGGGGCLCLPPQVTPLQGAEHLPVLGRVEGTPLLVCSCFSFPIIAFSSSHEFLYFYPSASFPRPTGESSSVGLGCPPDPSHRRLLNLSKKLLFLSTLLPSSVICRICFVFTWNHLCPSSKCQYCLLT